MKKAKIKMLLMLDGDKELCASLGFVQEDGETMAHFTARAARTFERLAPSWNDLGEDPPGTTRPS